MQSLSISIMSCFCLMMTVQKSIAQNNSLKGLPPGAIPVTASGYSMSAKINGKDSKAFAMMPADKAGEIVGFYSGDKYIGLPYHKSDFVKGKKFDFSNENADLTTADAVGVWGGRKGQMEITKVTSTYAEGKFYFTGYSYDNKHTIDVTDGFFRILLK
jgi:hypothetical protein